MRAFYTSLALVVFAQGLQAQTSSPLPPMPYRGELKAADGTPVTSNETRLTLRLFNASGKRLWYEVKEPVKVVDGAYTVWLGGPGNELTQEMLAAPVFLEVQVGEAPALPRQQMGLSVALVPTSGNNSSEVAASTTPSTPLTASSALISPRGASGMARGSVASTESNGTSGTGSGTTALASVAREQWLARAIEAKADIYFNPVKGKPVLDGLGRPKIDFRKVPVFIPFEEVSAKPTFGDWTRIHGGAAFVPKAGIKPFVMVEAALGRYKALAISENAGGGYNLEATPVPRRLTYATRVSQWGNLGKRSRYHLALGVSASKIGDKTGQTDDKTAFFLGGAYSLNPYVNLNLGTVILPKESGFRLRPAFGFSLDVASLGSIFGQ